MSIYEKLRTLNISLPAASSPVGVYVPYVRSGNLLFTSGHIAKKDGAVWTGQLGVDLETEQGREAAQSVAIDLIATLHNATGDLNRVRRILKLSVLVNSGPQFTQQHLVANGASELFGEVFGDRAVHVRSAFGVAQIPLGSCVEIELIAEVD